VKRLSTQPSFKLLAICHPPHHHPNWNIIQCDSEGIRRGQEATRQRHKVLTACRLPFQLFGEPPININNER
ncbi:unnamed protein product, partial [Pleuronectes platessa]